MQLLFDSQKKSIKLIEQTKQKTIYYITIVWQEIREAKKIVFKKNFLIKYIDNSNLTKLENY